jgi:hypothetical protein
MKIPFLFFTFILFAGCATVDIYSDYDHTADFTSHKTFAWIPNPDQPYKNNQFNNQIVESNIKNYASKEMQILGYTVDIDSPDLLIEYNLMIEKKTTTVQTPIYNNQYYSYPYPYYNHPYNYDMQRSPYYDNYRRYAYGYQQQMPYIIGYRTDQIPYTEGTLTISVIDRKTNKMIWRGWSVGTVTDPQSYEAELQKDIHKIFEKYPTHQQ